ncbi:3-hydroxyacyl-CoA dehydrogenase type-2 [Colletotrichum viniferum]|nr:3-hydroxyacyl-CoA dehydrogenase type-2 [Colletotrichum viniferum]
MKIQGRTFIVTGGASGLGRGCVDMIIRQGGNAAVIDTNSNLGTAATTELGASMKFLQCDITITQSVADAIKATLDWAQEAGKPIGGIITAAGTGSPCMLPDAERVPCSYAHMETVLNVNLRGTLHPIRQLLPHLAAVSREGPDGERGVLVMVASSAAFEGQSGLVAYSGSKGAVVSMTLPMARDLGQHGIRVVTIAPGLFETGMTAPMRPQDREMLAGVMEFPRRPGMPAEFARLVKEVIGNTMLNGEVIRLDGGARLPKGF